MRIEKVGNIEKQAKIWFDRLSSFYKNDVIFNEVEHDHHITNEFYNILSPFIPNSKRKILSCLYKPNRKSNDCSFWHMDGFCGMVIAAYPTPTQIYVTEQENVLMHKYSACHKQSQDAIINDLLNKGYGHIFTPKPGDLYLLDGFVIHRTNPAAIGKNHLVLRMWFD